MPNPNPKACVLFAAPIACPQTTQQQVVSGSAELFCASLKSPMQFRISNLEHAILLADMGARAGLVSIFPHAYFFMPVQAGNESRAHSFSFDDTRAARRGHSSRAFELRRIITWLVRRISQKRITAYVDDTRTPQRQTDKSRLQFKYPACQYHRVGLHTKKTDPEQAQKLQFIPACLCRVKRQAAAPLPLSSNAGTDCWQARVRTIRSLRGSLTSCVWIAQSAYGGRKPPPGPLLPGVGGRPM